MKNKNKVPVTLSMSELNYTIIQGCLGNGCYTTVNDGIAMITYVNQTSLDSFLEDCKEFKVSYEVIA